MEFNFPTIQGDKNDRLATILQEKFSLVSAELKPLLRVATKGYRKGKLIFRPEAGNLTYQIEDQFLQYVVRAIYDSYRDKIKKVTWVMHCNEWFSGSFVKGVFRQLDPVLDDLYNQLAVASNLHSEELKQLNEDDNIYTEYLRAYNTKNVFNKNNPESKPFWDDYNAFREKVMSDHPRIQKFNEYIRKDYYLRDDYEKMIKTHQNRFPEYKAITERKSLLYNEQWAAEGKVNEKIREHMTNETYTTIEKQIKVMVKEFIELITNTIISSEILN